MANSLASILARNKKILKRRLKVRKADVLLVSHAKSGRTWLAAMISHVYHRRYGIPEGEIVRYNNFKRLHPAVPSILFSHDNRKDALNTPLIKASDLDGRRTLLLVRDPRDVAVSAYFQSLRNEGALAEDLPPMFEAVLQKLPLVIAFLRRWAQQVERTEQAMAVRYEDLRREPEKELARIMQFVDGHAPAAEEIRAAVEFAEFKSLRQKEAQGFFTTTRLRPRDAGNPDSFKVRRGRVGGYRDYFNAEQLAAIEAVMAEAGLEGFGYAANPVSVGAEPAAEELYQVAR